MANFLKDNGVAIVACLLIGIIWVALDYILVKYVNKPVTPERQREKDIIKGFVSIFMLAVFLIIFFIFINAWDIPRNIAFPFIVAALIVTGYFARVMQWGHMFRQPTVPTEPANQNDSINNPQDPSNQPPL